MKNYRKYNQFISKHQSLRTQFHQTPSTEAKYRTLKSTLNLMNPTSVKSTPLRHHFRKEGSIDGIQQSEEVFIKQLNRMCEGQEQYQVEKEEIRRRKKTSKEVAKDLGQRKEVSSVHLQKNWRKDCSGRDRSWVKKEEEVKFIELPNFVAMLRDGVNGYARKSSTALLKKKTKKISEYIQKSATIYKENVFNQYHSKKQKKHTDNLKRQVDLLKQRAKDEYGLDFDQIQYEPEQTPTTDSLYQPLQPSSPAHLNINETQELRLMNNLLYSISPKTTHGKPFLPKPSLYESNATESISDHIPQQLLREKTNYRPLTVHGSGRSMLRRASCDKLNYFRI